ncbi:Zinc finger domain-containing protein, C2H2-type [Cordyceps fumosorosea ARSEF 2679]|uniref:Zinc finger domain-containing protein, C2H2-type n=1 Tax=Cordyceps fumosorosea (strain ARSEF 2679) TaxID=1081104 RepID=A0A167WPV5_CORFA|nr:Zinc finger domain-containing protein, C2H2-type [Cordyceps fumosorosea ARSEF 2679]OAA64064.1 Zinc finger domain-containing protein, C2H2-type [Cordyceps fumosorosea ARSEF 2679]
MASAGVDIDATSTTLSTAPPLPDAPPSNSAARAGTKRQRERDSPSPHPPSGRADPFESPTKAARIAWDTIHPSVQLTGAASLQDLQRRKLQERDGLTTQLSTTENPSHNALTSLMSGGIEPMSRPTDAPQFAPTADMEPAAKAASALAAAANSAARLEESVADAAVEQTPISAAPQLVASPGPMDVDDGKHLSPEHVEGQEVRHQSGSMPYTSNSFATPHITESLRGMTYPSPSPVQGSPTSSGTKKHRCPYCNTEFTRHHNLKSHLLTHSQEKPYVCTSCQMRFRRLHDLKRHGKLHTGEKPHICTKCDRKFARGDALARHAKGAGGCAGRRYSLGSFAEGDEMDGSMAEGDDSAMSGMTYDHGDEDELRRQSLPTGGHQPDQYSAQSRSYPPSGARPAAMASGLYPPNASQTQSSNSTASSSIPNSMGTARTANTSVSSAAAGGNTGLYSQNTMTESPKALSPALPTHEAPAPGRPQSPQQTQQAQSARRQSPPLGQRPKLPGLSHPFPAAAASAGYNHARSPAESNMFAQSDPGVWEYIHSMEEKMKGLVEEVDTLKKRVEVLESGING